MGGPLDVNDGPGAQVLQYWAQLFMKETSGTVVSVLQQQQVAGLAVIPPVVAT